MHDTLRTRILRRLETLPEERLYQVLDYIEFLESRYGERAVADPSGLQRIAERIEDGLRRRTFNPSNVREAFQLISAADRVLSSISDAGRELLGELGGGVELPTEPGGGSTSGATGTRPARSTETASGDLDPRDAKRGADSRGSGDPDPLERRG